MLKRKSILVTLSLAIMFCFSLVLGLGVSNASVVYASTDNLPPTIISIGGKDHEDGLGNLPMGIVGVPYKDNSGKNYKIVATGTAPFEYSSQILGGTEMPDGLTLNSETGEISGTPTAAGEYRITFSVSNDYGYSSVLYSIKIFNESDKPTITTSSLPNGGVGSSYYQAIEFDGYYQLFTATLSGNVPNGIEIVRHGRYPYLTGTPTVAGTFTFTVNINNYVGIVSKEFTITINEEPIAPKIEKDLIIFNDSYSKFDEYGQLSVVQGKLVDIQLVATGTNTTENPIIWELNGELPEGLTFDTNTARITGTVSESIDITSNKHYYCSFVAENKNSAGSYVTSKLSPLVVYKNGWKESVDVTPNNTTVQKGGNRKFVAVVNGWGDVDQTVDWYITTSGISANTKIDGDGILSVGTDETNTEITILAYANDSVKKESTVTIIDHTHNTVKVEGKQKTCETDGNIPHFKCSICNGLFSDAVAENSLTEEQVIIPAGHEYGTLIAKVNPTCSATGKQAHFECSACDKLFDESKNEKTSEELTIAKNPNAHDFDVWNDEVPATCVSEGTKAHKDCKLCHKHYADDSTTEITNLVIPIDPHGHNLETTWTGVEDGHYHICKNGCTAGHDEIQGHNPDRTEATETDPVKCTVCDYIITPAIGHTHNLTAVSGYGATCTTEGRKTYYKCSGCEAKFKDEEGTQELTDESWLVIPMAHQFGEWQDEVPATKEHEGTKAHKDCDFCHKHFDNEDNEIEDITIAKLSAGGDDTPTVTEKKGLSGGEIAGIVIGSVLVVSLGGFAIFWFAIKKKSFAELMEAIKSMFKKKTPKK